MNVNLRHFNLIKNYGLIVVILILSWFISIGVTQFLKSPFFAEAEHLELIPIFLSIVLIFTLGFVTYELSKPTILPSFVIAIFFGFVTQNVLSIITENPIGLSILTTVGAVLILFGGGLETPFNRFKSLMGPITSIALLGTIITAFTFSLALEGINQILGLALPAAAVILLGAALASTDPAAIIPSFKSLHFHKSRVKHIAVSESALNDVVGALITGIFLALFTGVVKPTSIFEAYSFLFTLDNLKEIVRVIAIGTIAGMIGFFLLDTWSKWKERIESDGEADAALFLAVPMFTYTAATVLGGNGFLSVFVTGMLFQLRSHVEHVQHYFNHTIEGFMKPLIFMLLGTLVDFKILQEYALPGIIMGMIFMFVLRPIAVFITLSPFMKGRHNLGLNELVFLSFVRETGVIPAVLLVAIKVAGVPGSDSIVAIGMWIILMTLIIQPPLTPVVAKALGVAEDIPPFPKQKEKGPIAVLCSRSYTFLQRIDSVVEWAEKQGMDNVMLLHCPEHKYSEKFLKEVQEVAEVRFKSINDRLSSENKKELNFNFVGRPGTLEKNIEWLVEEGHVGIIFVGSKMLDYRKDIVKELKVPFVFLE